MDTDQEALRAELRRFMRSEACYPHPTRLIRYTEGVKYLVEHAEVGWFIDVIAIGQPYALRDPRLRDFQLWEYWLTDVGGRITCSHDSEDVIFRVTLRGVTAALHYARLYVQNGMLRLPSEH
jgi:hypothetical protein